MIIWDIISIVVLAVIALALFRGWVVSRIPGGRRSQPDGSPRSLAESGGFRHQPPATSPTGGRSRDSARRSQPRGGSRESANPPEGVERPVARPRASAWSLRVQRQLSDPEAARMAFVLHEVLDAPVGMRDE